MHWILFNRTGCTSWFCLFILAEQLGHYLVRTVLVDDHMEASFQTSTTFMAILGRLRLRSKDKNYMNERPG
jgi:hypothetical protein